MKKILLVIFLLFLSSSAFATNWCDDASIAACYTIETGSGTDIIDQSANTNTGAFKGAGEPAWDSTDTAEDASEFVGTSAYSIDFDGSDDIVTVPDSADLDITGSYSIVMYAYYDKSGLNERFLSKDGSDNYYKANYYIIGLPGPSGNAIRAGHYTGSAWVEADDTTFSANTWLHIASTFDGSDLKLYFDGVFKNTTNNSGSPRASAEPLYIGGSGSGNYTNTNIDELAIFNGDYLSITDINDIMDNGLVQEAGVTFTPKVMIF